MLGAGVLLREPIGNVLFELETCSIGDVGAMRAVWSFDVIVSMGKKEVPFKNRLKNRFFPFHQYLKFRFKPRISNCARL